jgi:endonuclease YncB( thermonuclease family)
MPTDGSGLLKLTGDGSDQAPDWQPCATCTPDVTVTPPPPPPADVNPTKPGAFGPGKQATKPGGSGGSGGSGGKSDGPTNSAGGGGAKATTMTARVVKVLSANLVRLTQVKPRKVFELHLIGIDVPKSGQCGGTQSRAALRKLLIARNGVGRLVRVSTDAHVAALDSHRRVNGYMTLLTTGRPVALAHITAGWAKAKGGRYTMAKRFRTAQASAKKARRGVWRRCGGSFHARVR